MDHDLDDDFGLPPVRTGSLFSEDELSLLATLASEHDLRLEDITALIDKERAVQGMGRRHGINIFIREHIASIAVRRMGDRS